ncbi:hypothetical protein SmJEL517_g03476 [Synchytrium microbalum]|uniref:Uncharacterized protein n=1 Tax=Synchytrium microbalum TaxID=1806994 RepID=A0A507C6X9_9FUNG|nr:uncharacterized protein SmJEL517_g03476 [Synchytrium microbalum]TPX33746.1 hypothetical protein SmJEL517_g03476 [Synchytrium microbalum]
MRDARPQSPQMMSPVTPPPVQLVTPVMGPPGRSLSTSKIPASSPQRSASQHDVSHSSNNHNSSNASNLVRARSTGHDALTTVDVEALRRMSDPNVGLIPARRQSSLSLRGFTDAEYQSGNSLISSSSNGSSGNNGSPPSYQPLQRDSTRGIDRHLDNNYRVYNKEAAAAAYKEAMYASSMGGIKEYKDAYNSNNNNTNNNYNSMDAYKSGDMTYNHNSKDHQDTFAYSNNSNNTNNYNDGYVDASSPPHEYLVDELESNLANLGISPQSQTSGLSSSAISSPSSTTSAYSTSGTGNSNGVPLPTPSPSPSRVLNNMQQSQQQQQHNSVSSSASSSPSSSSLLAEEAREADVPVYDNRRIRSRTAPLKQHDLLVSPPRRTSERRRTESYSEANEEYGGDEPEVIDINNEESGGNGGEGDDGLEERTRLRVFQLIS